MIVDAIHVGGRWCLRGCVVLLTLALVVVGGAAARLSLGPISLSEYAPRLEAMANAELAAAGAGLGRVRIGDASLRFNGGRLQLTLGDVAYVDATGETAAEAARAAVKVDLASLARGVVDVRAAEIVGGDALLVRTKEGFFRFGVFAGAGAAAGAARDAADPNAEGVFAVVTRIVEALTGERGAPAPFSEFDRLVVRDLDLRYRDEMSGQAWRAPGATLDFRKQPDGVWARAEAAVIVAEGAAPVALTLEGRRNAGADVVALSAKIDGAPTWALAAQTPALDALRKIEGRVSGALSARLDLSTGDLGRLDGALGATDVALAISERDRIAVREARAEFSFDPKTDALKVTALDFRADGVEGAVSGDAVLLRDAEGRTIGAEGAILLGRTRIERADWLSEPLEVSEGAARAHVALVDGALSGAIEDLSLKGPAFAATGRVAVALDDAGRPTTDVALAVAPLEAAALPGLWPVFAAPGGRAWVAEHIIGGSIRDTSVVGRFGPDAERLSIDFGFDGLASRIIDGMPPITDGVGRGRVTLAGMEIVIESAETRAPDGAVIRLDGSRFEIPTFEPDIPPGVAHVAAEGPLASKAALLDLPPLALLAKWGVKPSALAGEATSRTRFAFPLAKALRLVDIDVTSDAEIADLAIDESAFGVAVAAPKAEVAVTETGMTLAAPNASVDGRAAALDVAETFSPAGDAPRRVTTLRTRLTQRDLRAYGAPADNVLGAIALKATLTERDGAPRRFAVEADLANLVLSAPAFDWAKAEGRPGVARLEGRLGSDDSVEIERFSVKTEGLSAAGSASIDAEGALTRAEFTRLTLGERVDLRLVAMPVAEGWRVAGGGARLDVRSMLDKMERRAATPSDEATPLSLDLTVAEFFIYGDAPLRNAKLVVARDAAARLEASIRAATGSATLEATITERDGRRAVSARSDDAGETFRALGLLGEARGGRLILTFDGPLDGPYSGRLAIENLVLTDVPRALDAVSVGTVVGALDRATSGGATFSRIKAPFRVADGLLVIDDAVATGPSFGVKLCGGVALASGGLDLTGSLSPAYAINGLVGEVPILGDLLTGGRGEGILGVAFTVKGDTRAPKVSVNPFSALTPGFLRKIFSCGAGRKQPTRFDMGGFDMGGFDKGGFGGAEGRGGTRFDMRDVPGADGVDRERALRLKRRSMWERD